MNVYAMTRSPLQDAVDTDDLLNSTGFKTGSYSAFRGEIDQLILQNLECSQDEYGDPLDAYYDNLNL